MCTTIVWAVNAAAFTPGFERFTAERLGIAPQPTELRIASDRVRASAVTFTITPNMCDCDSLIGGADGRLATGELTAQAWLGWLRELPDHARHLTRLALLRAWSPAQHAIVPAHTSGVRIGQVDEALLRSVGDDALLTIDYASAPEERI